MSVRIFITGSCSPGFGNWEHQLGNAAILIGLSETIHKHLPDAIITTKYQLSKEFCQTYGMRSLPVEPVGRAKVRRTLSTLYNLFSSSVWRFFHEVFRVDINFLHSTKLLDAYYRSDIIIDLSGDTYGDNIPFKNFAKHSLDLIAAQLLRKPIVSLANSPGPFSGGIKKRIAKFVFNNVSLITTREPVSADLLRNLGIKTPIITTACPAFLLKPAPDSRAREIMQLEGIDNSSRPIIGITLAGYNLYSKQTWDVPQALGDLALYVPTVRFLLEELAAQVVFVPHVYRTNPWTGQLIQGPDYVILKTLSQMVCEDSRTQKLRMVEGTYSPAEVKGLIGKLDLYVSGRLHAGVAALSQHVPTVLLSYGHKHTGFAKLLGQERCVWQPSMGPDGLLNIAKQVWEDRESIVAELHKRVPFVKELAELNVKILKDILNLDEKTRRQLPESLVNSWKSKSWDDMRF